MEWKIEKLEYYELNCLFNEQKYFVRCNLDTTSYINGNFMLKFILYFSI